MRKIVFAAIVLLAISCGKDKNMEDILLIPTKAVLVFPENVSECVEGNILSDTQSEVTFQWTASKNTDHYVLELTDLISKNTQTFTTKATELPITIARGTPYSWLITAINGSKAQESDIWSFYNAGKSTEYFIPFPAENIAPVPATVIPSNQSTVTLEWRGNDLDGDILEYDIYFGDTDPPNIYQEKYKQTTLPDIPLTTGKRFYWKIVTRDSLRNESSSNIFNFEVGS
ncbi:MAG TPA: hypothetical protein VLZ54_13600 [Arenibacter sp.]|nr:hypothetical protein [Arenibacter sp.]